MKKLLLFIFISVFSWASVDCAPGGGNVAWVLDESVNPNPDIVVSNNTYSSYSDPDGFEDLSSCDVYNKTDKWTNHVYLGSWYSEGTDKTYYDYSKTTYTLIYDRVSECPLDTELNTTTYLCDNIPPPPPECPENYTDDNGTCVPDVPDDIDNDGIPNSSDPDIDGDGIPNSDDPDIDGDGTPNGDDNSAGGGGGGDDNANCLSGAVYSSVTESCVCLNGTDYSSSVGCTVSTCPSSYNNLPLKLQNVTSSKCTSSYPPYMGYASEYISDGYISCCYADKVADELPCPTNQYRDNEGVCEDIPSSSPECGSNEYLDTSLSIPKCLPVPCEDGYIRDNEGVCQESYQDIQEQCLNGYTWNNAQQKCIRDNVSGDGSVGGGGSDNNNPTGGNNGFIPADGDTVEKKVLLEFTSEEVAIINDEYSTGIHNQFTAFLDKYSPDLTTIFNISVPSFASCGCGNPVINYKGKSKIIDICSPLDTIFGYMRPVLWFGLLLSILFGFFRGGNN